LLSLISISGAVGTYSVYSSLSVFLLNTCSYIFVYVLLPLSVSILVLSLVGSIFSSKRFEKTIGIFKWIFKIVIGLIFGVFGLFSLVNLVSAGARDGVSLKLTKFAIKNYVPVLGGYISEGFDFVHSCSILIKNAFGVCGIVVLFFIVLKPLILCFSYILLFKILSFFIAYITSGFYSDTFENASKCLGCLVAVLVGVFLIMFIFIFLLILSVSVI
jgi:stage III sporulation protein AE